MTQLFSEYRDFVEKHHDSSAAKHMEQFRTYADVYKSFDEFWPDTREGLFFYRLEQLDTTTFFPLLLEVMRKYGNGKGQNELHEILTDVESFFVRRTIGGADASLECGDAGARQPECELYSSTVPTVRMPTARLLCGRGNPLRQVVGIR